VNAKKRYNKLFIKILILFPKFEKSKKNQALQIDQI